MKIVWAMSCLFADIVMFIIRYMMLVAGITLGNLLYVQSNSGDVGWSNTVSE